jgi:hypothetical protein
MAPRAAIDGTRNIYNIIYSPSFMSGSVSVPGSVSCFTDREWLIASEPKRKSEGIGLALLARRNERYDLREGLQSSPYVLDHPHMNCVVASAAMIPDSSFQSKSSFG